MSKLKILITGASGFVGQRYLSYNKDNYTMLPVSLRSTKINDIDFSNIETIIHLAGIAHQMTKIDDQIYFDVNLHKTIALAKAAKENGIKQFIFISTVKVYGDDHKTDYLDLSSPTLPNDAYGQSKLQAEEALLNLETASFKVAIVRPPLVYGPGVKGNLIKFLHLAQKSIPLPFKGIENKRSMVYIDNLIAMLNAIADSSASGVYIAGDREPMSTSTLLKNIYLGSAKQPNWFKMPKLGLWLLKILKPELVKRLYGSYIIDNTESNKMLNFTPPYTSDHGIRVMTEWFIGSIKKSDA